MSPRTVQVSTCHRLVPKRQARAQAGLSTGNVSSVPPLKSSTKFSCSTKLLQSFYNSRSASSEDFAGENATEKLPAAISDPQSSSTKFQRSISSTKFFQRSYISSSASSDDYAGEIATDNLSAATSDDHNGEPHSSFSPTNYSDSKDPMALQPSSFGKIHANFI